MPPADSPVGIRAIRYVLPTLRLTLPELHAAGLLESEPDVLAEFGFHDCRVSDVPATVLAQRAIEAALAAARIPAADVDLLVNATAVHTSGLVPPAGPSTAPHLDLFKYSSPRIQDELGLDNARVLGLSELSCVSLMSAVALAKTVMEHEGLDVAVCVNADVFPAGVKREVVYNLVSDSACAVVLVRGEAALRLRTYRQVTRGYYWDAEERQNELIASYFPTARRVIEGTLAAAGLAMSDIDLIIPHNVSARSWEILARLLKVPGEKIYTRNIAATAHSVAADNFINLHDALERGDLRPGDKAMLFCFGLGAHWGCSVLDV